MAVLCTAYSPIVLFSQEQNSAAAGGPAAEQSANSPGASGEEQYIIGGGNASPPEAPAIQGGVSSVFLILRMILVLALAAAAIYGIIYLVKKISLPKNVQDPYLRILSSASIGLNRSVHVISVGDRAWLVGAADNAVSLISEIDDRETIDAMLLDSSRRNAEGGPGKLIDFKSLFSRAGGPRNKNDMPGSEKIKERRERFKGF